MKTSNYNNTRKTVRRVGVVQKRFENTRKKGGRGPLDSAPPLNPPTTTSLSTSFFSALWAGVRSFSALLISLQPDPFYVWQTSFTQEPSPPVLLRIFSFAFYVVEAFSMFSFALNNWQSGNPFTAGSLSIACETFCHESIMCPLLPNIYSTKRLSRGV